MKKINKIIKAIERRNVTVIHDGLECLSLDIKDGVLLWCKLTDWLGVQKDIKYFCFFENQNKVIQRNFPIYKKGKVLFLDHELDELLTQIY